MSGGSYNYLCHKDVQDLLGNFYDLQEMCDRLAGLGYAKDAARETAELIQILRQAEVRAETIKSRLEPVWRAVEWWDSCDSGEDSVKQALSKYRGDE